MSSRHRRSKITNDTRQTATPSEEAAGAARRSLWKVWRRLLWTSTVASACTTTRVQTAPLPERLPTGKRGEIRISLKSGEQVTLYDARVVQDSIVGFNQRELQTAAQRIAVARADVQTVSTTQISTGKTVLAVIGGALATLSLVALAACASLSSA